MGASFQDDELNTQELDRFMKALNQKLPDIRVGVLKDSARQDGHTNVEIGTYHEFGTSKMPQRSFLRVPLADKLSNEIDKRGLLSEDLLKNITKNLSVKVLINAIGKAAKDVVLNAFDTAGFGKWASWSKGYSNSTGQVLKDTQSLKNSIDYEVK
jgi:phage gpG-like protein